MGKVTRAQSFQNLSKVRFAFFILSCKEYCNFTKLAVALLYFCVVVRPKKKQSKERIWFSYGVQKSLKL